MKRGALHALPRFVYFCKSFLLRLNTKLRFYHSYFPLASSYFQKSA